MHILLLPLQQAVQQPPKGHLHTVQLLDISSRKKVSVITGAS